jgi:hypothetical protein
MRSTRAISAVILFVGMVLAGAAAAGRSHTQFRWVDGGKVPHYSDTLTMDALQYGYDVLNDRGIVVKHIDRQRTPEELFAEEAAAAEAANARREAEAQAQSERRMLAAYPTEKDFIAARQAQLDSIDQNVRAANNSLGVQEKSLSDALEHASSFEHSGKRVPDSAKKQIETLRKSAEALHAYVERRQREKAEQTAKFQTDLAHYREARSRRGQQ